MPIEKQSFVDQVEVTQLGVVQIRTKVVVVENSAQISGSFHRHVVAPGDDYSGEDERVQAVCKAIHTSAVIAAYKATLAAQGI